MDRGRRLRYIPDRSQAPRAGRPVAWDDHDFTGDDTMTEQDREMARADFRTAMTGLIVSVVLLGIVIGGASLLAIVLH
jgi:hypothetical protein